MANSALLDALPEARRFTIYHEEDGKTRVETRQDVDHIVKAASIMADEAPGKDFRHAAYIPETVLNQAMVEGWFHDKAAWKKWANDPANECFRTWKGRL
jgi:hypothetical protein